MSDKKLTTGEIIGRLIEVFGSSEDSISDYAHGYFEGIVDWEILRDLSTQDRQKVKEDVIGLGEIVEVDRYGGEGQGERWWTVKHFVDHDVYLKTSGHYSSYNGTDFYDWGKEVKPVIKTVTVFE